MSIVETRECRQYKLPYSSFSGPKTITSVSDGFAFIESRPFGAYQTGAGRGHVVVVYKHSINASKMVVPKEFGSIQISGSKETLLYAGDGVIGTVTGTNLDTNQVNDFGKPCVSPSVYDRNGCAIVGDVDERQLVLLKLHQESGVDFGMVPETAQCCAVYENSVYAFNKTLSMLDFNQPWNKVESSLVSKFIDHQSQIDVSRCRDLVSVYCNGELVLFDKRNIKSPVYSVTAPRWATLAISDDVPEVYLHGPQGEVFIHNYLRGKTRKIVLPDSFENEFVPVYSTQPYVPPEAPTALDCVGAVSAVGRDLFVGVKDSIVRITAPIVGPEITDILSI